MVIPKQKYLKCTPELLKQAKLKMGKDPNGYLRQFGVEPGQGFGADGKPLVYGEKEIVLLEY